MQGLSAQDALHWAINDKLPVPVADTEDREAKSAALRAALLDFHRCVKSAKYITPRDAAPQPGPQKRAQGLAVQGARAGEGLRWPA